MWHDPGRNIQGKDQVQECSGNSGGWHTMRYLGLSDLWKYYNTITFNPNRGPLFSTSVRKFGTLYLQLQVRGTLQFQFEVTLILELFTLQHTACLSFVVKHDLDIKQRNQTAASPHWATLKHCVEDKKKTCCYLVLPWLIT